MGFYEPKNRPELTYTQKEMIRSMARNRLALSATAREMNYARNSLEYHLARVKAVTGLDPREFYDMVKLIEIVGESDSDD